MKLNEVVRLIFVVASLFVFAAVAVSAVSHCGEIFSHSFSVFTLVKEPVNSLLKTINIPFSSPS